VGIFRRGRWWYLRKRVPRAFEALDPRRPVVIALRTDSEAEARARAVEAERALWAYWRALEAGETGDAAQRYAAALELATRRGVAYRTAAELAAGPLDDLVARLLRLARSGEIADPAVATAELGLVEAPRLTLTQALDVFFTDAAADRAVGKSDNQRRKWEAPRRKAVANFVALRGDKALADITRDDALALRAWWRERAQAGDVRPETANKDFGHLADLFRTVNDLRRLGLDNPFTGLRLADPGNAQRPSFSVEWITAHLVAPEGLAGLNDEARDVLRIMVNTGAGLAEVVGARLEDLALDHATPHLVVTAHAGRQLKTGHRGRAIPLLGVSLEAARRRLAAGGFPRYGDSPDRLSAVVNKFLAENKLRPTPAHTAYSLRHSFQDRMIAAELPERLQAHLMGHKLARPRYGAGPTLEHLAGWLEKVAL
jgi:integrase